MDTQETDFLKSLLNCYNFCAMCQPKKVSPLFIYSRDFSGQRTTFLMLVMFKRQYNVMRPWIGTVRNLGVNR